MTRSTRLDYYTLEGFRPEQRPRLSAGSPRWGKLWTALLQALTPNHDPIIKPCRDRQGLAYYRIYDPVTGDRFTCRSETEVRQWLEQRYRR